MSLVLGGSGSVSTEETNKTNYADFPGILLKSKGVNIPLVSVNNQEYVARIVVKKILKKNRRGRLFYV